MSDKSDHINKSEKDFLRYLSNEMTEKERNAFEKNLQKNAFEEDALEGISTLSPSELKADISELNTRISGKSSFANRSVSYRVAAGIAILFTISSLFYIMLNRKISEEALPVGITESTQKPEKDKNISGPQLEMLEKPENPTEKLSQERKSISGISAELKKEEKNIQTESPHAETIDIIAGSADPEENEIEAFSDNQNETPSKESIMTSEQVLAEGEGGNIMRSSQKTAAKKFHGRIVSSDDYQPVPGANVIIKGTSTGTISNSDGKFELYAGPERDTSQILEIAFIGMERQEILADAGTNLNIVLNPSEVNLDEVVVTGYGSRLKSDQTVISESTVSVSAIPLEGQKLFKKYISENQQFPETNIEITKANVVLEFLVNTNGLPFNIKIIESPGKEFSDEAIRLLEKGPEWIPASPVSNLTRISIILQKEKK
jgi:antitoxin component of RelBE/YafQ-DinJ toxin-antitoxin module